MSSTRLNHWKGSWQPGSYTECSQVVDNGWLSIANKTTSDRPQPQPQGSPFWMSGLGDTPAWATPSDTASQIVTGQRITLPTDRLMVGWRASFPVADPSVEYSVYTVEDPLGARIPNVVLSSFVPTQTGWQTVAIQAALLADGNVYDLLLVTNALSTPTQWSADWDYKRKNDSGISDGEIWHHSNGRDMRVAHIDKDDNDQQTQLEALNPGDKISGGGVEWDILLVTLNADHVLLEVSPASRAQENTYTFTFTTYGTAPITYERINNHYLSDANIRGFFSSSGYDPATITLDDDCYGIDLQEQNVVLSPDWDIQAFSG